MSVENSSVCLVHFADDARVVNARLALYIDFWAVLYGHFVELSGQHHRPAIKADLLIKLFGRHYVDRSDDVLGQLMDRLDDHVQTARKAFADRKLDVVS